MTPAFWLVTALLVAAALVVAWPVRTSRRRRRALFDTGARRTPDRPSVGRDSSVAAVGPTIGHRSGSRSPGGPPASPGQPGPPFPVPSVEGGPRSHPGSATRGTVASGAAIDSTVDHRVTGRPTVPDRPYSPRPPGRRDPRRPTATLQRALGPVRPDGPSVSWSSGCAVTGRTDDSPPGARSSGRGGDGSPQPAGRGLRAVVRAWTAYPPEGSARWSALGVALTVRRGRVLLLVGAAGGLLGGSVAGPVAGAALAGYGVLGVRAVLGRRAGRLAVHGRRRRLDQLSALAADLRAGLPVPALPPPEEPSALHPVPDPDEMAFSPAVQDGEAHASAPPVAAGASARARPPAPEGDGDRLGRLTRAAVRLADRTGAPLAELLERIEADARALDRGLAAASAQAAGARATALLLAALPLGGIGLGYGIGADPVSVLLHTRLGGACAVAAIGLQTVGLLWAERLGRVPGGAG